MSSSLMVARWYTRTKNFQLYNSISRQPKEISSSNPKQRYRGGSSVALITTLLLFTIKLPSYIKRYSD